MLPIGSRSSDGASPPVDQNRNPTGFNGTSDELTRAKKSVFIIAMKERGTVKHAADSAGISRETAYNWRDRDPAFAEAWANSIEDSAETLEASLYERALRTEGMPGVVASIAILKSRHPERWSDKYMVTRADDDPATAAVREFTQLMRDMRAGLAGERGPAASLDSGSGQTDPTIIEGHVEP